MYTDKIKAVGYCRFSSDHQKELSIEAQQRAIEKLKVVYSKEPAIKPSGNSNERVPGSIAFVPSVVGLIIASEVIKDLIK